jgi:hypothetical protein
MFVTARREGCLVTEALFVFGGAILALYATFTTIIVICENTLTIKNWVKCIGLSLLAGLAAVVITVSI